MSTQKCSDSSVNSNFDPATVLVDLQNCDTVENTKEFFRRQILEPMISGKSAPIRKEKRTYFQNQLENFKTKDQVIRLAYNLALAGMGHGRVESTYSKKFAN